MKKSGSRVTQAKITSFFTRLNEGGSASAEGMRNSDSESSEQNVRQQHRNEGFGNLSYLPLYYQNVRSIPARTDLRSRIKHSGYKSLAFTETRLSKNHQSEQYFPQNFNVYRCDRDETGGGVALLFDEQYKSSQIETISDSDCESVCVKVKLSPCALVIYLAYVNDSTRLDILLKHYELIRKVVSTESDSRVMMVGDFNLHDIEWNSDESEVFFLPQNLASHTGSVYFQAASEFLQKVHDLPMFQLSNLKNISSNVLDLVFVNGTGDMHVCKAPVAITLIDETDKFHVPIELQFEYNGEGEDQQSNEFIEVLSFKRANYERINRQLGAMNFAEIFERMNVQEAFDYFLELLNRMIIENVPKVRIKKENNRPKWWTREWQQKKNKRDKTYKRKPKNETTAEYSEALKEFKILDENLNKEYISQVQQNIIEDPSAFWSYAKFKKKTSTYPREMSFNGRSSDEPEEIVGMFADFFEGLYVADECSVVFDEVYGDEPEDVWEVDLTMWDIEKAINNLDAKKGAGPDGISPIFMKCCVDVLVWPLWILHKKQMESGSISTRLKISKVVPVYKKKGKKSEVKSYRITAISSVILKIYESAIQPKLLGQIDPRITNAQHAFRPKRSIETNLLNLSIAAHDAFSKKQQLDSYYGDFETAFDKVWHRMLIIKMKRFRIGKKTAKWLFEFVNDRKFFVKIGQAMSRVYTATSGVPAGSILGPTLFVIFINDIVECIAYALPLLFADDIKLAMGIASTADARHLQADINNVLGWCETNRLPLNQGKCEVITIARIADPYYVTYFMGDHVVERKQEVRDLGIPVDPKFTLVAHMERSITRARQSMGYIKTVSKGQFDTNALVVLYKAYVRSKLEFASVIWDPHQQNYSDDIESVQKQFVMYALGDTNRIPPYRLAPYEERCEKIGLEKLSTRRKTASALMAFDLYNKRINDTNIEAKLIRRTSHRSMRNDRPLAEAIYASDYGMYQPLARMIRLVNEMSDLMTLNRSTYKTEVKKRLRGRNDEGQET